jgi:hypothetical protein
MMNVALPLKTINMASPTQAVNDVSQNMEQDGEEVPQATPMHFLLLFKMIFITVRGLKKKERRSLENQVN